MSGLSPYCPRAHIPVLKSEVQQAVPYAFLLHEGPAQMPPCVDKEGPTYRELMLPGSPELDAVRLGLACSVTRTFQNATPAIPCGICSTGTFSLPLSTSTEVALGHPADSGRFSSPGC